MWATCEGRRLGGGLFCYFGGCCLCMLRPMGFNYLKLSQTTPPSGVSPDFQLEPTLGLSELIPGLYISYSFLLKLFRVWAAFPCIFGLLGLAALQDQKQVQDLTIYGTFCRMEILISLYCLIHCDLYYAPYYTQLSQDQTHPVAAWATVGH